MLRNLAGRIRQPALAFVRRAQSSVAAEAPAEAAKALGKPSSLLDIGLAGGMLGGLVGLGAHGGAIMQPAMMRAGYSAALAAGTASVAVVAIGISSTVAFGSSGKIDWLSAGTISFWALVGARYGRVLTGRIDPSGIYLQRAFGLFQIALAPMVPAKAWYAKEEAKKAALARKSSHGGTTTFEWGNTYNKAYQQFAKIIELAVVGTAAGAAFGMLGVGGGIVITPALCLITDLPHSTVLGTTLAAMLPPSVIQMYGHLSTGNVAKGIFPLLIATSAGAYFGGKLACEADEETLQFGFAVLVFALGGRRLLNPLS